jgi:hypothetical protein
MGDTAGVRRAAEAVNAADAGAISQPRRIRFDGTRNDNAESG